MTIMSVRRREHDGNMGANLDHCRVPPNHHPGEKGKMESEIELADDAGQKQHFNMGVQTFLLGNILSRHTPSIMGVGKKMQKKKTKKKRGDPYVDGGIVQGVVLYMPHTGSTCPNAPPFGQAPGYGHGSSPLHMTNQTIT